MCKQIKKCEPLIEFVPFGMRMPQINYLTINVLKPERCDVYFLVEKATQFYNCLDSELSNENKYWNINQKKTNLENINLKKTNIENNNLKKTNIEISIKRKQILK